MTKSAGFDWGRRGFTPGMIHKAGEDKSRSSCAARPATYLLGIQATYPEGIESFSPGLAHPAGLPWVPPKNAPNAEGVESSATRAAFQNLDLIELPF
jgi:hypothetical protein